MKKNYYFFLLALFPMLSQAAPATTYRAADHYSYQKYGRAPQSAVTPYSAQTATQWYQGTPQAQNYRNEQRRYPPQPPHIAVVTPHVEVYVHPQTQHNYQRTEEVYLPYGGSYRSVTEYAPTYPHPRYGQPKVIIRGDFYAE